MPKRASRNRPSRWSTVSIDLCHQARSSLCGAGASLLAGASSPCLAPVIEVVAQDSAPPDGQASKGDHRRQLVLVFMEGPEVSTRTWWKKRANPRLFDAGGVTARQGSVSAEEAGLR